MAVLHTLSCIKCNNIKEELIRTRAPHSGNYRLHCPICSDLQPHKIVFCKINSPRRDMELLCHLDHNPSEITKHVTIGTPRGEANGQPIPVNHRRREERADRNNFAIRNRNK